MSREFIQDYQDLGIYKIAFDSAMKIFELSKNFPLEEKGSLTEEIILSSRFLCADIALAWRLRRNESAFIEKLNDCEAEAAKTQTWIEIATRCGYLNLETAQELDISYNQVLSGLVNIVNNPSPWLINRQVNNELN